MSYMLQHLRSGWAVDQAIITEEERLVCIRFGHDYNPECIKMDELLYKIAEDVKNFCVIYLVDITEVPDFNGMYELYDPVSVMFFYRNKHMMIDLGTGNNNKINWAMNNRQELIDIIETIFRGARKEVPDVDEKYIPMPAIVHSDHAKPHPCCVISINGRIIQEGVGKRFTSLLVTFYGNHGHLIPSVKTIRHIRTGRGLVISPKDYSTKYRY